MIVGSVVPLVLAFGVVYAGYWVSRQSCPSPCVLRVAVWTYGGAIAILLLAGLIVAHQYLNGNLLEDAPYILANSATGGAIGGFVVGVYDGQNTRKSARIETIHEATRNLINVRTVEDVCSYVVTIAHRGLGMSLTGVWLYDGDSEVLEPIAITDESEAVFGKHPTFTEDNSLAWEVFSEGGSRLISDVAEQPNVHNPETPIRSELVLSLGGYGVLIIGSTRKNAFDTVDVTTAKVLASTTVAALERAEREEKLRTQQRELHRRATQHENFARIVSHDIRNPLAVAMGYLELARETSDERHFDQVDAALRRMESIVENVLWLAREGREIGEKRSVNVEETARTAWQFVETGTAQLRCDCEWHVCADTERLQQLFENFFRNAVEHGGPDVTVTVGTLDDGFFVEDTGPGISPAERENIFEAGYSTAENGVGFGLAIVGTIAGAHGWEITVTEGSDGGARFEITRAEVVEESCCANTVLPVE